MIWFFIFIIIILASLTIATMVMTVNNSSKIANIMSENVLSSTLLANRIIVNNSNVHKTLGGTIESTKQYMIDGIVNLKSTPIIVPDTGINIVGLGLDVSTLKSENANYTMFISPLGGSGNIFMGELTLEVSGTSSKVFSLQDSSGFNAIEMNVVNFNDCSSLGNIENYRQLLETGTGRFGGSPSLELIGVYVGGYRLSTSIVRSLANTMTEPLFKAGAGFTMASRFLTDINCDLPELAALTDFAPANFVSSALLQFNGTIITRDGEIDSTDPNITPNINETNLKSYWKNNQGLENTFVGGRLAISADATTTITDVNTFYTLNATTWTSSKLQHFDTPAQNQLRFLGSQPTAYNVIINMTIDGPSGDTLTLRLTKYDVSETMFVTQQDEERVVNNLAAGPRDVAFFNVNVDIVMNQNDYIFLEITNNSNGTTNVTAEIDSYMRVEER